MLGRAVRVAVALAVVSTVSASAASLNGLGSKSLGADHAVVGRCDTSTPKFTFTYTTHFHSSDSAFHVHAVTVGDIAPPCNGGNLSVTLADADDNSLADGGPVAVSGASRTVTLSSEPLAGAVKATYAVIEGP